MGNRLTRVGGLTPIEERKALEERLRHVERIEAGPIAPEFTVRVGISQTIQRKKSWAWR